MCLVFFDVEVVASVEVLALTLAASPVLAVGAGWIAGGTVPAAGGVAWIVGV
jgi:hypothetical protein